MRDASASGKRIHRSPATSSFEEQDDHHGVVVRVLRETVPRRIASHDAANEHAERQATHERSPLPFGSAVRVGFGLIWVIDAYFKWQPSFVNGLLNVLHDGTAGQPGWLMPWFTLTRSVMAVQPTLWAYAIALVETGIALAVLLGVARKLVYIGGAVWTLMIWATAEGLGRTAPGAIATDIGTGIIYAVAFLALLAADRCAGTRPWSLDAVIERRVPWWRRIAEVG